MGVPEEAQTTDPSQSEALSSPEVLPFGTQEGRTTVPCQVCGKESLGTARLCDRCIGLWRDLQFHLQAVKNLVGEMERVSLARLTEHGIDVEALQQGLEATK